MSLHKERIQVKLSLCADLEDLVSPVFRQILSIQSDFPQQVPDRGYLCFKN